MSGNGNGRNGTGIWLIGMGPVHFCRTPTFRVELLVAQLSSLLKEDAGRTPALRPPVQPSGPTGPTLDRRIWRTPQLSHPMVQLPGSCHIAPGVLGVPNGSTMAPGEGRNCKLNSELANGRLAPSARRLGAGWGVCRGRAAGDAEGSLFWVVLLEDR